MCFEECSQNKVYKHFLKCQTNHECITNLAALCLMMLQQLGNEVEHTNWGVLPKCIKDP